MRENKLTSESDFYLIITQIVTNKATIVEPHHGEWRIEVCWVVIQQGILHLGAIASGDGHAEDGHN